MFPPFAFSKPTRAVHLVGKGGDDAKLNLVIVARDAELGALGELHLVDLNLADGRVEGARPVDQPLAAVDQALLMEANKALLDSSVGFGGGGCKHVIL